MVGQVVAKALDGDGSNFYIIPRYINVFCSDRTEGRTERKLHPDLFLFLLFTVSETVGKGCESNLQGVVNDLSRQSSSEGFQLNEAKCKELRISFANSNSTFNTILLNRKPLEEVSSPKLLDLRH